MDRSHTEQDEHEQLGEMANYRLQRRQNLRRVSFPENDTDLVTGYLEPVNPLHLAFNVTNKQILEEYMKSCHRHGSQPIPKVVDQIKKLDLCKRRSHSLDLKDYSVTMEDCEPLEEIFKRVQFLGVNLENCQLDDYTAVPLFEMLEYYDSTWQINVGCNNQVGMRGWKTCATYLKKSSVEAFDCHCVKLMDAEARLLFDAFFQNKFLRIINLESCSLDIECLSTLVNALKGNHTLKELYLGDNDFFMAHTDVLCLLLTSNFSLELLDLSNNHIEDFGFNNLATALCDVHSQTNLKVLIIWNNCLTSSIVAPLCNLLKDCRTIEVLNLGKNELTDQGIVELVKRFPPNRELTCLGLQSTDVTCQAAIALSDHLRFHLIERIDLRGNTVQLAGVAALCEAVTKNKRVLQIDLDEDAAVQHQDKAEYRERVAWMDGLCRENRLHNEKVKDELLMKSPARKMSLTCQTIAPSNFPRISAGCSLSEPTRCAARLRSPIPSPVPSPTISPICSPTPLSNRGRFSVSRVSEAAGRGACGAAAPTSRFTVTVVEPARPNVTVGFEPEGTRLYHSLNAVAGLRTLDARFSLTKVSSGGDLRTADDRTPSNLAKLLDLFQRPGPQPPDSNVLTGPELTKENISSAAATCRLADPCALDSNGLGGPNADNDSDPDSARMDLSATSSGSASDEEGSARVVLLAVDRDEPACYPDLANNNSWQLGKDTADADHPYEPYEPYERQRRPPPAGDL